MLIPITIIFAALILSGVLYDQAFATSDLKPFSIFLPDHWSLKSVRPYAYANSQVDGNYILVDSVVATKKFSSKDDFHNFIKSTEYVTSGFGLGNSITTTNTDYGFKSAIELKLKKSDGNTLTLRKDYHYVNGKAQIFEVHGYSSDFDTRMELRKTLDTFRPA